MKTLPAPSPVVLFFKSHVGSYLRNGKTVSGYEGRTVHDAISLVDSSRLAKELTKLGMDADRHESFSRRIDSAEHGAPGAVKWARAWLADMDAAAAATKQAKDQVSADTKKLETDARAMFEQGRADDPKQQAYLDTQEDPAGINGHADYLGWLSQRMREFEKLHGITPKENGAKDTRYSGFTAYVRAWSDQRLAKRLK